jgi:hypothetical protein
MQDTGDRSVGEATPVAARVRRRRGALAILPLVLISCLGAVVEHLLWRALGHPEQNTLAGYLVGFLLGCAVIVSWWRSSGAMRKGLSVQPIPASMAGNGGLMQVTGILSVGEATPVAARVHRRIYGSAMLRGVLAILPPVLISCLGAVVEHLLWRALGHPEQNTLTGYLVGFLLGCAVWRPLYMKWCVSGYRRRFAERGQSRELPLSLEIEPTVLRYTLGGVEQRAQWSAVTDLIRVPGYWVFIVQADAYFAADRFFANTDAQRAFVAEALSHMTEAARARSADAEAFARPKAA